MALTMTLGQNKMYNVIQHSAPQGNCVIVSQQPQKSVIQSKRPLAPAPERSSVLVSNNDLRLSLKRFRPRDRHKVVALRKKLSKVETLRLAVEYIRSLQQMIDDHEGEMGNGSIGSDNLQALADNRYYTSSPDSTHLYSTNYPVLLPTPACSEASASPTPSHSSEGSFSTTQSYTNALYHHTENYENYDPKSPEDEELLDAIFFVAARIIIPLKVSIISVSY
ncbi:hypothetical protein NQ317_002044 [Molorchus minor]|uniref:BHLH domain-containing protein n=1 Tax=Molorchus minor TaxID=1323400 RepID=A0ABQ9J1Y4_9CUCU|nr:hypothetical protein NQ317_002044 [Molorchus minor]